MTRSPFRSAACAGLMVLSATIAGCSSPGPTPAPAKSTDPPPQVAAMLWGDLKPIVSVKELMKYMIDPIADNLFDAVGTTVTRKGTITVEPKTEQDWDKVRTGAVSLMEGIY